MEASSTFWSKVQRSAHPTGCWLWSGATVNGYGNVWFEGRAHMAHRVAWLLSRGDIPPRHRVGQSCRNRLCVRPEHLVTGTASQLWSLRSERNGERGEALPRPEEIHHIQTLYFHEKRSIASLGREFGMHPAAIDRILQLPMCGELETSDRESSS